MLLSSIVRRDVLRNPGMLQSLFRSHPGAGLPPEAAPRNDKKLRSLQRSFKTRSLVPGWRFLPREEATIRGRNEESKNNLEHRVRLHYHSMAPKQKQPSKPSSGTVRRSSQEPSTRLPAPVPISRQSSEHHVPSPRLGLPLSTVVARPPGSAWGTRPLTPSKRPHTETDGLDDSPVPSGEPTLREVMSLLVGIQSDTSSIRHQLTALEAKYDTLLRRVEALERQAPMDFEATLADFQNRMERRSNFLVYNLPELSGEDVMTRVYEVLLELGKDLTLSKQDFPIVFARRVGRSRESLPRPILVRFASEHSRSVAFELRKGIREVMGDGISIPSDLRFGPDYTLQQRQARRSLRPIHDKGRELASDVSSPIQSVYFRDEHLFMRVQGQFSPVPISLGDSSWHGFFPADVLSGLLGGASGSNAVPVGLRA
ncbi:hypothetical protein BSKO_04307 [Bryopsis sp. KO-2023]|nr:hypothetical protein BSKO_04307 [Bryopsis sp. KO-2023]